MKIILLILLSTCLSLANSEYPRFMRRVPQQNGPPRIPGPPQFSKKWNKPPQKIPLQFMQSRPYPVPLQQVRNGRPPMHLNHGMNIPPNNVGHLQHPMIVPKFQQYPYQAKPQLNPKKAYFKNPVQHQITKIPTVSGGIQFPQESNQIPNLVHKQEKLSFVSSPSIPSALEYDYHIQTNSIPTNTNPIKQIGEKGPIHTIPAPNLTPADKPNNLDLRKELQYGQQQEFRFQQPQFLNDHQYQVTEPSEQPPKQMFREQINLQTHFNQNQGTHPFQNIPSNQPLGQQFEHILNQQIEQPNGAQNYQNLQSAFNHPDHQGLLFKEDGNHAINIDFGPPQEDLDGQEDMVFSNSKHYQVVSDQFSTGDQNQNIHTQAIQSSFAQQHPQVLAKFLEEPGYVQQYQHENVQAAADKSASVNPEYQTFNFDELAHQAQDKSGQTSYVTAAYSLGSSGDVIKADNIHPRSSSVDPLTQAQIVQNYFNTRSHNAAEPDAKPSVTEIIEREKVKSPYYSSLPNKEAAERLAKLQAAGKVNSSLMKLSNNNRNQNEKANEMPTIYVPDDNRSPDEKQDRIDEDSKEQSLDYEDYSQEEAEEDGQLEEDSGFGHKVKSRK